MQHFVKGTRLAVMFAVTLLVLFVYAAALYKLQVYDNDGKERNMPDDTIKTRVTLTAARGDVLDRNGELLISSVPSYNVTLSREELLASGEPNRQLLALIAAVTDYGASYTDTFPVTVGAPFAYVSMTDSQRSRLNEYLDFFHLDRDISATDLMVWLKNHYGIDFTSSLPDTRKLIGVRYELECRAVIGLDAYVFVEDSP